MQVRETWVWIMGGIKMKKKFIAAFCILVTVLSSTACGSTPTGQSKGVFNVSDMACIDYSEDISADNILSTIRNFSASDNARISGFEGEKNTADYISKQFKDLGFEVTEQSFPVKAYKCTGTEVDIAAPESKKIGSQFLTFSKATPNEGITSDIVFGGMGTDSELDSARVKGKLVLMKRGGEFYRIKVERAYTKGAVGAIFYDPGQELPVAATLVEPSGIPAVSISRSDGESIEGMLTSGKSVRITIKVDSETKDSTSKNIIARMKSKKQSGGKNIVVGAHYDGVDTPAANDNASGKAALLEAARVI
jgi:aminopeptidase YwaD